MILVVLIVGLAAYLLVPQFAVLESSWDVVQAMTWWAVALAAIAQICSYLGGGFILHSILKTNHEKLAAWKGALIAVATFSISLVAGGGIGLAATYGWVHKETRKGDTAVLAGMLPGFLNTVTLVLVAMIGTLYLLFIHDLRRRQLFEFAVILLFLSLMAVVIFFALHSRERVTRIAVWLTCHWARLRHRPYQAETTVFTVQQFFEAVGALNHGRWLLPMLGSVANIGFDMLTLYFMFVAAGQNVPVGFLFAGYGLPILLGRAAFIFPGGIGVVEGSMVALYDSLQIPDGISVVVILGYRFLSFWMPALVGFLAATYLSGGLFNGKKDADGMRS